MPTSTASTVEEQYAAVVRDLYPTLSPPSAGKQQRLREQQPASLEDMLRSPLPSTLAEATVAARQQHLSAPTAAQSHKPVTPPPDELFNDSFAASTHTVESVEAAESSSQEEAEEKEQRHSKRIQPPVLPPLLPQHQLPSPVVPAPTPPPLPPDVDVEMLQSINLELQEMSRKLKVFFLFDSPLPLLTLTQSLCLFFFFLIPSQHQSAVLAKREAELSVREEALSARSSLSSARYREDELRHVSCPLLKFFSVSDHPHSLDVGIQFSFE